MEPTENSCVYPILNSSNNKRPDGNSNAAQPPSNFHSQGNPKCSKVSAAAAAAAGTSTSSSSSTQAIKTSFRAVAEHFFASADFRKAADAQNLACPICEKSYAKAAMKDHLDMAHIYRGQYVLYQCTYPGCTYTNAWGINARTHARREHNGEQYIVKPAAAAAEAVPTTRTAGSALLVSSSSAAGTVKRRAAATTISITSKPSTARTSRRQRQQQKQQKQQRPSTSASTSTSQGVLSAEDYLRANCPEYAAAGNSRNKLKCPDCPMTKTKYELKDHFLAVHRRLKPYHCQWPGCSYTSGWRSNAARHVREVHKGSSYAEYIVYREEE